VHIVSLLVSGFNRANMKLLRGLGILMQSSIFNIALSTYRGCKYYIRRAFSAMLSI